MSQNLLPIILGIMSFLILTAHYLDSLRNRRLKRKNWEENKIPLTLLLVQSVIVVASIIVNSVFYPIYYPAILIENIINFIVFIITFLEGYYRKKALVMATSIVLMILFLISY